MIRAGLASSALLGAAVLAGCASPPNSLEGSLDEVAPLTFDATAVRASPQVLVVEYDHAASTVPTDGGAPLLGADGGAAATVGTDVVFKLVVDITGLKLDKDLSIDLSEKLASGAQRAVCTRSVGNDPRRNLPDVARGELFLDSDVVLGKTSAGHFHALFAEGGDIGEGRTVEGTFSAVAADANPGAQP